MDLLGRFPQLAWCGTGQCRYQKLLGGLLWGLKVLASMEVFHNHHKIRTLNQQILKSSFRFTSSKPFSLFYMCYELRRYQEFPFLLHGSQEEQELLQGFKGSSIFSRIRPIMGSSITSSVQCYYHCRIHLTKHTKPEYWPQILCLP